MTNHPYLITGTMDDGSQVTVEVLATGSLAASIGCEDHPALTGAAKFYIRRADRENLTADRICGAVISAI